MAEDSAAPMALLVAARLRELRLGRFGGRAGASCLRRHRRWAIHRGTRASRADHDRPRRRRQRGAGGAGACAVRATAACDVVEVPGASHRWRTGGRRSGATRRACWRRSRRAPGRCRPRCALPCRPPACGSGLRTTRHTDSRWMRGFLRARGRTGRWCWCTAAAGGRRSRHYIAPMLRALAAARGLASVSIDYRLTPAVRHREQLEDVKVARQSRPSRTRPTSASIRGGWCWSGSQPARSW